MVTSICFNQHATGKHVSEQFSLKKEKLILSAQKLCIRFSLDLLNRQILTLTFSLLFK